MKIWEQKNEDYLATVASDDNLSDSAYVEVLEDLIDRAQSMINAKHEEMDANGDDEK